MEGGCRLQRVPVGALTHISTRAPGGRGCHRLMAVLLQVRQPVQLGRAAPGLHWRTFIGRARQRREVMAQAKLNAYLASQCFVNQELDRSSSEECKRADFYDEVPYAGRKH